MSNVKVSEGQLQEAVAEHFKQLGYVVMSETPFFTKRIDLFAVHRASLETVAIELKMRDWKRALFQARIYLLCADRVFVAMPSGPAHGITSETLGHYGVGLLAIDISEASTSDWSISIVMPAPKSVRKKDQYIDRLRGLVLFGRFGEEVAKNAN